MKRWIDVADEMPNYIAAEQASVLTAVQASKPPQPTSDDYWTQIDESRSGYTKTYEHRMPHGVLIRVATSYQGCAESIVFVPLPPPTEPYR